MISKSELRRRLKRSRGDKIFRLVTDEFINEILEDETLDVFSEYYPQLVNVRITKNDAVPYTDYNGKFFPYKIYRIPKQFPVASINGTRDYVWRDIENYYICGNDASDVYSGGNFVLNQYYLSARAAMPHTRSYYQITFQEPDIIVVDPPLQSHRNFELVMQAKRTLDTVPRNMKSLFLNLFVADVKIALYNRYKHEGGSQTYGGIEIDMKIDDYSGADSERKEIIDIMEKDWMLNPERFEVANLYNTKA